MTVSAATGTGRMQTASGRRRTASVRRPIVTVRRPIATVRMRTGSAKGPTGSVRKPIGTDRKQTATGSAVIATARRRTDKGRKSDNIGESAQARPERADLVVDVKALLQPHVRLYGSVDDTMFRDFQRQMDQAPEDGDIVIELMTFGGDADVGRRIALDVREAQQHLGRVLHFIGKTVVYSAGVTIMAAFPQARRCLAHDTVLLIHERQVDRQLQLNGPMSASVTVVRAALSQLEIGLQLQQEGFDELIAGSDVGREEIDRLASTNWYVTAEEALKRKLVARLL